ncbi:KH domain-containing protein [Promineifilum sp.]|uniref:KH domain-containing protein n=1 Tax=Promineifilum sp. TaxID=2664178 RepID=UPI0035AEA3AC
MKDLVTFIVESLVDHPEEVQVAEVRGRGSTVIELSVAAPDMGRVIGKGGRVIDSVRALLQVRAAKEGKRVELELLEADNLR